MEESKALHRLGEATDLIGMIEEIVSPATIDKLNPAALSGVRITLRNIREMIQVSHSTLSNELVARSRNAVNDINGQEQAVRHPRPSNGSETLDPGARGEFQRAQLSQNPVSMTRRDLKASLEKLVERDQQR